MELFSIKIRCTFQLVSTHIGVLHHPATGGEMGREHSDHLAAREAGTHQGAADRTACPVSQGTDRPHQEPESYQQEG